MQRILSQPWRLIAPLAMVALSLALSACGPTGGQPLPTQPPAATKPPAVTPPAAASPAPATQPPAAKAPGDPAAGQQAIARYGCGGCHMIPGVQGASGTVGPSLAGFANRTVIAGTTTQNTPENLVRWIMNPPAVKPGTAMPNLNVNQTDAQNIAAYLLTLR